MFFLRNVNLNRIYKDNETKFIKVFISSDDIPEAQMVNK